MEEQNKSKSKENEDSKMQQDAENELELNKSIDQKDDQPPAPVVQEKEHTTLRTGQSDSDDDEYGKNKSKKLSPKA